MNIQLRIISAIVSVFKHDRNVRFFTLIIFIISFCQAIAQNSSVSGYAQNIETGQAIEFVHIFFANTTIGTATDEKGNFTLDNLSSGEFDLVASFVGYKLFVKRIKIIPGKAIDILINMTPELIKLDEIEVSDKKDMKWQRQLKRFTKEFLGNSPNARQCKILNPWVINFDKDKDSGLNYATSDSQIEVLNEALGYKLFFYLKHFNWKSGYISYFGYPRFEALDPDSEQKEEKWKMNRSSTYEGSLRHFFYAIVNNRIDEEGFQIYQYKQQLIGKSLKFTMDTNLADLVGKQLLDFNPVEIVRQNPGSDQMVIDFYGKLEVIYKNIYWAYSPYPDTPYQVSTIQFKLPVRCTKHGYVFDQLNYEVSGYFILSRIADMLPFEYGAEK